MATYRQDETTYEDGYGELKISYVFSDDWDGLFSPTYYSINVIKPDKVKYKQEQKIGQLASNDFKFTISEAEFSYDDNTIIDAPKTQLDIEQEFLSLCTSSVKNNLFYVGIFVNAGTTPSISESIYIGAIDSKLSFDDLHWADDEFGVSPTPLRSFSFECTPGEEAVIDEISLQAIIDNISASFESTYVFNANGFYKESIFETRIPKLVHFNELLKELARSLIELWDTAGYGTWTITYQTSKIDGKVTPIRWGLPLGDKVYGPIVNGSLFYPSTGFYNGNGEPTWTLYDDEVQDLYIVSTSAVTDEPHKFAYIPYCVIKPNANATHDRLEYNETAAKELLWQKNERVKDSFTNLLYSIATDLGMFLEIKLTGPKAISISFLSKSQIASNSKIYIKDVSKASGEIAETEKRDDSRRLQGSVSYMIAEPYYDKKIFTTTEPSSQVLINLNPMTPKDGYPLNTKGLRDTGVKNLLSIGILFWTIDDPVPYNSSDNSMIAKAGSGITSDTKMYMRFPYNLYLTDTSGDKEINGHFIGDAACYNSASFSNQMYLRVDKRVGETKAPTEYWTPIGRLDVKRGSEDNYYYSLADFVNQINQADLEQYSTKYKLDVPYLMCASTSSLGTAPSIMNLAIGKIITIDGLDYILDSYEIDLSKMSVSLELTGSGRYNFGTAALLTESKEYGIQVGETESTDATTLTGLTLVTANVSQGELVSLVSADSVEPTEPLEAHYGRILGVATHDAVVGETVNVQISGKIVISWLTGSVNDAVFARVVSATENMSTTPLTVKTVSEDYYIEVGKLVDTNTLQINIKEGFIYL